jgi:hypothetical protein
MVVSIVMGRRRAGALKWYCWEGEGFGFNHKFMIKVQKSSPSIMVTRNPMVYESLGKGLVV